MWIYSRACWISFKSVTNLRVFFTESNKSHLHKIFLSWLTSRVPTRTSRWATPAATRRPTRPHMWAAAASRPRTAPGRRACWATSREAFGVSTICWRECLRGASQPLPPPPPWLPPRAARSLAQVAASVNFLLFFFSCLRNCYLLLPYIHIFWTVC